uniref:N/A n=1 Tax=Ganoderma boninense TaxID=34458 RepID=A0A5K1JV47_9APHY|nr:N/A [Ganoderma boninense]
MFPHSPALVGFGFSSASFAALALALLPQAAARFASITFSTVDQCGNFTIQFAGGDPPDALPLSLAILPLNGTPISIPLPLDVWNSTSQTGAAITFLPYPANTQFIASLDDANGQGAATVSDVLVINPSKSADASCLPTDAPPFAPQFSLNGTLAQCKSFTVDFDASKNISSPTIRAVVPKGVSSPVRETEANATGGVDTYLMDVARDSLVLLQLTDSKTGHSETTTLLPVLGVSTMSNGSDERVTPKVAIIVISVAIGVIALVAAGMIAWYFFYRRKAQQARKFTKLDEAASPSSAPPPDPEKQMPPVPLPVPPRIITTTATAAMPSPLSPADSGYAAYDQFVQNPSYIRMGSTLITPTSPDMKDPFGERPGSSLLGPLSAAARDSASSRLGATALGNNRNGSSTLALAPRSRMGSRAPSPNAAASGSGSPAARQSSASADLLSDKLPGTSPYWGGRLAVTPDNSLASLPDSILRKHTSARSRGSTASVSSVEIDRILEMATIYSGAGDDVEVGLPLARPQPAVTAPATLRSSAYMAGRESRRQSVSSPVGSGSSPTHSRNNSGGAATTLNHSGSHSTLRLNRAFRDPPLAPLPSSPLPSPGGGRPSFSFDGPADRDRDRDGRASRVLPRAVPPLVGRNATASTRGSVYSQDVDPARRS